MQGLNSILHVMDQSLSDPWALERACRLAADTQAQLTCLLVAERLPAGGGFTQEQIDQAVEHECRARLESLLREIDPTVTLSPKVSLGRLHIEVIREVLRGGQDLVVKGADGGLGIRERLLGSRDMHLLRKCPCPVWLLRPESPERYRRILAAVDVVPGDPDPEAHGLNRRILDWASRLALAEFAELHLAHAWDAPAAALLHRWTTGGLLQDAANDEYRYVEDTRNWHQYALNALVTELGKMLGPESLDFLAIESHLPKGPATDVIPDLAADLKADLIVMGTVGRGGIPGLLIGNTAETILNRCDCAVLAIKPPSFVSPVEV